MSRSCSLAARVVTLIALVGCAPRGPSAPRTTGPGTRSPHAPSTAPPTAPATTPAPDPDGITFVISNGFGDEAAWVGPHLAAVADVVVRLMDSPELPPPARVEVTLVLDPEGRHGGWATSTGVGYVGDRFPEEAPYVWILTHEVTNLMAAHYGGHGGFPSDWWSNGRSPFPTYFAGLVLREVGHADVADGLRRSNASQPDHELYWTLHERYGFGLFAETLRLLRRDDLDLGEIEPPWPHPDATRTAYTIAYLSLAAGEDLTDLVLAAGVGSEPVDWADNHLDIPFVAYTVTPAEVAGIRRARARAFGAEGTAELQAAFRRGAWRLVPER